MKTIYTNIKINNEKVKRNRLRSDNEKTSRYVWTRIWHTGITAVFVIIGISVCVALIHFVFMSPYFNLVRIEVSPLKQIERGEILSLAKVDSHCNLLTLRTSGIAAKIMTHPWVEKVRIQKHFPDKLRIEVTERKPVAVIPQTCGMLGIDEEGYVLPGLQMKEVKEIPLITVQDSLLTAYPNRITAPEMQNALYVIQYLKNNDPDFLKEVSELNIVTPDNVIVYTLHEGTEIRLGNENLDERLAKLQQVWQLVRQQQLVEEYIDLRFDKQGVVTKPKNKNIGQNTKHEAQILRT